LFKLGKSQSSEVFRPQVKQLLGLFVVVVVLASFHAPLLTAAGDYLKIGCEAKAGSDAIVVLGGELNGERTRKGAELYRQGLAPVVIFSEGTKLSWRTDAIEEMRALAVLEGVPAEAILEERRSRSTYENAFYTRELMEGQGMTSALVVTSDWHGRRAGFIFGRVFEGSGIRVDVCGAIDDRSDFADWWKDGEKQQVVLTEWAKTIVYWAKYGV